MTPDAERVRSYEKKKDAQKWWWAPANFGACAVMLFLLAFGMWLMQSTEGDTLGDFVASVFGFAIAVIAFVGAVMFAGTGFISFFMWALHEEEGS